MKAPQTSPLLTDLYQLAMLQVYQQRGLTETAVFEFAVRALPTRRGFLVAAGLEPLLEFLETIAFTAEELEWLSETKRYHASFLEWLATFRFNGDVDALPEGTVFFANEPVVRVTASLPEAQLIETRLINLLQLPILIASKAARVVLAADGRQLIDFGLRRAHGAEAAVTGARASYLAGFDGASNVFAEKRYGIPAFGTMAHSFVEAHDSEVEAFLNFSHVQKGPVVLLLDTYDTEAAARKVVEIAPTLNKENIKIRAVRLDSGDLAQHAQRVRDILDGGGLKEVGIFVSGGLNEDDVQAMLRAGAPVNGFGVGTHLETSADAPYLDCAYKLVEYAGKARRKTSEGKASWPGRKQVFRRLDKGTMQEDVITLEDQSETGEALLQAVMRNGKRSQDPEPLEEIRQRCREQLAALPPHLRQLKMEPPYPVHISDVIRELL